MWVFFHGYVGVLAAFLVAMTKYPTKQLKKGRDNFGARFEGVRPSQQDRHSSWSVG